MSDAPLRTSVRSRLATLTLTSLVAGACAEGSAFGPLPDDRVYAMAASTPVVMSSWNDGKYYGEHLLIADTLILRTDGTGELRTYVARRRVADTTQWNSTVTFSYSRSSNRITLRIPWQCSGMCPAIDFGPSTSQLDFIDGVLHRDAGAGLMPYRRIE